MTGNGAAGEHTVSLSAPATGAMAAKRSAARQPSR
jgi:hypothetical protein